MDIGVHMLDMALHVLGEPTVLTATAATYAQFGPRGRGAPAVAKVRKTGVTEAPFDVEDLSTAFLRLAGGATLLLESSWAQWIPEDHCYVTLYGSEGGASIEWVDPSAPERTMSHLDRAGRTAGRARHDAARRAAPRVRARLPGPRPHSTTAPSTADGRRWPAPRSSTPATPRPNPVGKCDLD